MPLIPPIRQRKISRGSLENAQNRLGTYAFFLGEGLAEENIDAQALTEMTESSLFDFFTFINRDGISLFADGRVSDTSDSEFYQKGIQGEKGIVVEYGTSFTDATVMSFYAPVRHEGEIIGVLRGVYTAEAYLQSLLSTTYFGEAADVFLCMQDGTEIARLEQ